MIYNLGVFDRILLLNILPEQSEIDRVFYRTYHDFLCDLSFSEEEYKCHEINYDKGGVVNWKCDKVKAFEINGIIKNIIIGRLKACKEREFLFDDHKKIYNMFCDDIELDSEEDWNGEIY